MLFEQADETPREVRELGQRSSYLRLKRGRKDERCRQESGALGLVRGDMH